MRNIEQRGNRCQRAPPGFYLIINRYFLLFVSPGPPVCGGRGRVEEKAYRTIVTGIKSETTTKTLEGEPRQWTPAEVSRAGPGVTNPGKSTEGMWWLSMEGIGICGLAG